MSSRVYQSGVISASSGNVANAAAVATLAHDASGRLYVTGFEITATGATTALPTVVTLTGLLGGTLSYIFTFPAGVLVAAAPLVVEFGQPLAAVDTATDVVLTLLAGGSGNTNASVNLHGFRAPRANILD